MSNMTPMNFIKMLTNGTMNPNILLGNVKKIAAFKNPELANVINLFENGDKNSIEEYARKFCEERGCSFDEEFQKFMNGLR